MIKTTRIITLNHSPDNVVGNIYLDQEIENILIEGGTFILSASVMLQGSDGEKVIVAVNLTPTQGKVDYLEFETEQIFKHP